MDLVQVSNGSGLLLPHSVLALDENGEATDVVIEIRQLEDLVANVTLANPIRPTPLFSSAAVLPNGSPGNHYFAATFTEDLDLESVLDRSGGGAATNGLTGAISVIAQDPVTGATTPLEGRVFIDGSTLDGAPTGVPAEVPLVRWIELDENGKPSALGFGADFPGRGFPGTEDDFAGAAELVSPRTIVFVADSDDDLSTHETFPSGSELQLRISSAVRSVGGDPVARGALASTALATDSMAPEILRAPPPLSQPTVTPGNGDGNVDPATVIRADFSEPIQPVSLGSLDDGSIPSLSAAILLEFGPPTARTAVPFTVEPISVFDLSSFLLTPVFAFPGEGPDEFACGVFNRVDVTINADQVEDLAGNRNTVPATTFFTTGEGPGVVNAPVAPDAIYLGTSGANSGLSVIDGNGFGQGTGNPSFDPNARIEGNSHYVYNPNLVFQGSAMLPSLQPPQCTFDGGSAGVFTKTRDSSLSDVLLRAPLITAVEDMMLGRALDASFNNGPAPYGCQSGGQGIGNQCAFDGLKLIQMIQTGPETVGPPINFNPILSSVNGGENPISWAPSPNPPPLIFPPPCVSPFIGGQEPTSVDTPVTNLLVPGDPFGNVEENVPPSGLLSSEQNSWFQGPSLPTQIQNCSNYMMRQQIGHFLYTVDRARNEIVVLNSNRMTVIDRIEVPDPVDLAISPNLDLLAVTSQTADLVTFIGIDPGLGNFHEIVTQTVVGAEPRGIAWDPGNEDILVCNEGDNSVSVLSAFSLQVRKVVQANLSEPFDVAITPRQATFGFFRNVYFAYILNRSGRAAIFESGPNGVNGWGFDDIVGVAPQTFLAPKAIQVDHTELRSGAWIAHEGPIDLATNQPGALGEGAVTRLVANTAITGPIPLGGLSGLIPNLRDMSFIAQLSLGSSFLSGVPVDFAFDNQRNFGALPNVVTPFSAGTGAQMNGKGMVRVVSGTVQSTNEPSFMYVAVPNSLAGEGAVDVLRRDGGGFARIDTNPFQPGTQSIPAPGVNVLMDYFRQ